MNSSLPSYDLNRLFGVSGTIPKDSGGEAMILEEGDNAGDDEDDSETEEDDKADSLEDDEDKEVVMSDSLNAVSWSEEIE